MKTLIHAAAIMMIATGAFARDNIQVTGSSTVLPYATIAAESFSENFDFTTPVVEGGGTGAGIKKFCEGIGENTPDIVNASRKIKEDELATCAAAGVTEIIEARIGFDGIVFASKVEGNAFSLTTKDIYLALNANSTFKNWKEVNPSLPDQEILMFIPGTKHGTREVFDEKVLQAGCKEVLGVEKLDDAQKEECTRVRTDGVAVDIDGDYTETLARLETSPLAIGVFGLSFYENNMATLQVADINGVTPSQETIAAGDYPVSRPLYFYVKKQHIEIIPGLKEFAEFYVSDEIANGILVEYGLVADPELATAQAAVANEELVK